MTEIVFSQHKLPDDNFFHHPIQFQYLQYHFLANGLNVFPRTGAV